ncbi:MAG TPA: DUF1800 domain-containing protein [Gemmataceae bacterium]|nr:DUF1800 domain-containing protein [Gemmataceae bacterium]
MLSRTEPFATTGPWAPYQPSDDAPWNLRRVVHLHRRAGFAATWNEIQRDLQDGPGTSVYRLLAGKARSQGVPENFEPTAALLADSAKDVERLKAWWVYRMLFGPDPLTERLTLLWHNHFATSAAKVTDVQILRRQNSIFRELARAPFGALLERVVRDPALLLWLDAPANRKEHPNENLGRELLELFTLGIGHYTERDVKEAARALTGWTVVDKKFREDAAQHDPGDKTILGKKGAWKGSDLVQIVLAHPATARRLAWRLWQQFMGEPVDAAAVDALATGLRQHNLDIGWATGIVLRSQSFFASANLGNQILGPIEYVVGSARLLELFDQPLSTLVLADWAARLGQELFYPPNVGGWAGGRNWIGTQSMIGRMNYAASLVGGGLSRGREPLNAEALAKRHGQGNDLDTLIAFYAELVFGAVPSSAWHESLLAALGPNAKATPENARRIAIRILSSPQAQVN